MYDIDSGDPSKWIRLRDTGAQVTLTVKEIEHDGIDGAVETEVVVGDFDTPNALLRQMGFAAKSYQETRQASFSLAEGRLELDWWPLTRRTLRLKATPGSTFARLLGIAEGRLTGENTIKVYARHGLDLGAIRDLRFPAGVKPSD